VTVYEARGNYQLLVRASDCGVSTATQVRAIEASCGGGIVAAERKRPLRIFNASAMIRPLRQPRVSML
jgi:hypothetical protein